MADYTFKISGGERLDAALVRLEQVTTQHRLRVEQRARRARRRRVAAFAALSLVALAELVAIVFLWRSLRWLDRDAAEKLTECTMFLQQCACFEHPAHLESL